MYSESVLIPTQEQQDIISAATHGESFVIEAGAGSAKTTTLKMLAPGLSGRGKLAVAFNSKIAKDLAAALPVEFVVKTLNGLGHAAWMKQRGGRLEVEEGKIGRLTTQVLKAEAPEAYAADEDGSLWLALRNMARELKANGFVPEYSQHKPVSPSYLEEGSFIEDFKLTNEWDERLVDGEGLFMMAQEVLVHNINEAFNKLIDFDDQIYMTTRFFCPYPQFDVVLVDEAQDLSAANHLQLLKCKPKQLIPVGDRRQAIYAFRGADSESIDNLLVAATEYGLDMKQYRLATSFRCPKAVVSRQLEHYPEFRAAEQNPEGEIGVLEKWSVGDIPAGGAVICRNNAPLIALAFKLIRNRRGFTFLGQNMAKNLKGLIKKVAGYTGQDLNKAAKAKPTEKVLLELQLWYEFERKKLEDKKKYDMLSSLLDRRECARMILKETKTLGEAMEMCDKIFSGAGDLTLSSGHRSKGLEWRWVMHLDPFRIPSKFAVLAAQNGSYMQLKQENNLRYVIETRTKLTLVMAKLDDNEDVGGGLEIDDE